VLGRKRAVSLDRLSGGIQGSLAPPQICESNAPVCIEDAIYLALIGFLVGHLIVLVR
jgi:hypothetical protein